MSDPLFTPETRSGVRTVFKWVGKALLWSIIGLVGFFIVLNSDWSWERFSYAAIAVIALLYIQDIENRARAAHAAALEAKNRARTLEDQLHGLAARIRVLESKSRVPG